jgi:hypothetical protein
VRSTPSHTADAAALMLCYLSWRHAWREAIRALSGFQPDLRELSESARRRDGGARRRDVASIGTALPKIQHDLGMLAKML